MFEQGYLNIRVHVAYPCMSNHTCRCKPCQDQDSQNKLDFRGPVCLDMVRMAFLRNKPKQASSFYLFLLYDFSYFIICLLVCKTGSPPQEAPVLHPGLSPVQTNEQTRASFSYLYQICILLVIFLTTGLWRSGLAIITRVSRNPNPTLNTWITIIQ